MPVRAGHPAVDPSSTSATAASATSEGTRAGRAERLGDQRRDPADEHGAGQGDPVGRAEPAETVRGAGRAPEQRR